MMVVIEVGGNLVLTSAGIADRTAVSLRARRLDRELAGGAAPESRLQLAIRAQQLTRPYLRQTLARTLERIAAEALRPQGLAYGASRGLRGPAVGVGLRSIAPSAGLELAVLISRLRGAGPVTARGMAHVALLLTEGGGPLHRGGSAAELRAAITLALYHLDHPEVLAAHLVSPG